MICTGPSVLDFSFWDMKWQGVSLPLLSPPPAKWITCPSQVISSVVRKHSLRVWYPFILQDAEGHCEVIVMPKTQWPTKSRTSRGKRVFQENRIIETRRQRSLSPPPSKKGNNSENQQASDGQTYEQQTKPNNLPKTFVSFLTVYSR